MEYQLTEHEQETVKSLYAQAKEIADTIERLKSQSQAVNGAIQGVSLLIANQQGFKSGKDKFEFSPELDKLIVVSEVV